MKIKHYEDWSYSLITSTWAIISNNTIVSLDHLLTNTRFEKFHYLCQEWYDDTDANEILDYLEKNINN